MIHVTMQSGDAQIVPAPEPAAVAALVPLVSAGGGDIGQAASICRGVRLTMCARPWDGAVSWDIARGGMPLALCVLCRDAAAQSSVWHAIESQYLRLSDIRPDLYAPGACPAMPATLPWMATLLLPGAAIKLDVMSWLADFDQCVAHTALEVMRDDDGR